MKSSYFNYLFTSLVSVSLLSSSSYAETTKKEEVKRPNIIWLFSDDHSHNAISAYGGRLAETAPTPNIDRLAKQGMLFDRSYVANSICGPARACILTGMHSHNNGVLDNSTKKGTIDYNKITTFPQLLQKSGYQTALFGKWHLKVAPQGFDDWAVLPGQGLYYNTELYLPDSSNDDGRKKVTFKGQHSTKLIMDLTIKHLDEAKKKSAPFMVMCQFKAPHRNWLAQPDLVDYYSKTTFPEPDTLFDDYATRGIAAKEQTMSLANDFKGTDMKLQNTSYDVANAGYQKESGELGDKMYQDHLKYRSVFAKRQQQYDQLKDNPKALTRWKYQVYMQDYLASIKGVDEQVGRLLDYLEANDMLDNTIIAYSSDQSFYLGEHGWYDKRFMYEESFRTPLIIKWPGIIEPNTVNTDLVQNIDIAPTLLDVANVTIPKNMDGESLTPILKQQAAEWRKSLYYHYYQFPGTHDVRRHEGVFDGRNKLIRFFGKKVPNGEYFEFYDIEEDPKEINNLYGNNAYSNQIEKSKTELQRLRAQYNVPNK